MTPPTPTSRFDPSAEAHARSPRQSAQILVAHAKMAIIAVAALFSLESSVAIMQARSQEQTPEYDLRTRVKAGVVFHLLKHIEWPDDSFEDTEEARAPIVLTIVGRDAHAFDPYLRRLVANQRISERRIDIRQLQFPMPDEDSPEREPDEDEWDEFVENLRESHLVFIARSEAQHLNGRFRYRRILAALGRRPILTVSDIPEFAGEGGMIGLSIRDNHWAIDANITTIRRTELRVGSRLLALARIIDDDATSGR